MSDVVNEVYQEHKESMLNNLIADQTTYNTDNREQFHDHMGVYGYLKEEVEETEEALEQLKDDLKGMWTYIRNNAADELIERKIQLVLISAREVMLEALDVAAVAQKALNQLGSKKAPTTDQSK